MMDVLVVQSGSRNREMDMVVVQSGDSFGLW